MRNGSDDDAAGTGGNAASDVQAQARVARDLARLGVDRPVCPELSRRLEPLVRLLSPEAYGIVLAGVLLTHRVYREREAALARSVREIAELQKLLGAFADELRKVDEVLAALTAQAKRVDGTVRPAVPPRRGLVH